MSSTPAPDHYKVLGVAKDAQVAEIRLAYRKLVLKCHPDKVQDPALKAQKQEEFQKVQQAYELLTDEEERRKYDDQVKLAELKEQLRKANVSGTPRSNSKYAEYEIRTAEPRASSYKPATNVPPPAGKGYSYPRSFEDDVTFRPPVYQTGSSRTRQTTYVDSRSKRETERDREAAREKEKEKDRERRKKDKEDQARREKEAKEAKEARRDKRTKEKQRDKDIKRESEEKKKHAKPSAYVSSKKYEDKRDRDRSSQREDIHIVSPPAPAVRSFSEYATSKYVESPRTVPAAPEPSSSWEDTHSKLKDAASYIEAARAKEGAAAPGGLKRSMTYAPRMTQPPAAPTPPPAPNQASVFPVPDEDDVRRSSARPRRGSTESNRPRDRYSKSSREPLTEPVVMSASPNSRHAAHPAMSGSPPHLSRNNTMPADTASYPRAVPITRSQTYNNFGEGTDPRGRNRTRYQSQIDEEEIDSDEVHGQRAARDRRHRTSRREQSVDQGYGETSRYPGYESNRQASYSRRADPEPDRYAYYSSGHNDGRPSMPVRDSSYSTSAGSAHFAKVKTSKAYGYDDVQYTHYHSQKPREEYTYA
ncbi:hypothetical protein TrVGV298_011941 [Trichoderma virens]|nr:hypothetical protein TrVGV298_011941 [Trichoderma virens]